MTLTGRPSSREAPTAATRSVEVAEAAALATLVAAVSVVDRIVPLGFAGFLLGAFPLAVLGSRHRLRVGIGGVVTATVLVFLGAGPGLAGKAAAAAAVGFVVGAGLRRGWSTPLVALVATLVPTLPATALGLALLAALSRTRELVLGQILDGTRGLARIMGALGFPEWLVRALVAFAALTVERWPVVIPAVALASGFAAAALTASLFRRPLETVTDALPGVPRDLGDLLRGSGDDPAPLPLRMRGVGAHRGGRRVVGDVDLDLDAGRMLTVTGPNGAGKSTLARLVAGLAPDEGVVDRPGGAGLGAAGGTAMVFQRPESQVLGVRVGEDLRWGVTGPVDVPALLARVGLDGDPERETDTLSGGELQRLALAAALARDPAVVVSDETTAMLDEPGRVAVVTLLRELAERGTAVVHVTHRPAEIEAAEHRLALAAPSPEPVDGPGPEPTGVVPAPRAGATLTLTGVEVVHDAGTPWRRDVLSGVDLVVPAGETLLVTGPNGAGKTTLAWVLAGLAAPSGGEALLDGEPVTNGRDGALLAVQHARLALLRTTVGEDVRDAAGTDTAGADAALAAVGLDPERFRHRPVDALSGGEARRALLAGLLAAEARVLVLDEPLAGLDDDAVGAVVDALAAVRASGVTLVVTTHDVTPLAGLADAVVTVADGTVGRPAPGGATSPPRAPDPPERPTGSRAADRGRPPRRPVRRVGRTLPGSSPATRLRAGTKLGVLVVGVAALGILPAWPTVAAGVAVLAAGAWAGRVPPSAWPRPPVALLGAALAVLAVVALGGEPDTALAGVPISLDSVERTGRLLVCALLTLAGSILFVATTPVGSLPPLLRGLAARLRFTRLPVDEWAVTVALGLRLAPTLAEQARTVRLVLGQRRRARAPVRRGPRQRWRDADTAVVGVATLVCATALRRAAETADALVARGGLTGPAAPDTTRRAPARRDVVAATVAVVLFAAGAAAALLGG